MPRSEFDHLESTGNKAVTSASLQPLLLPLTCELAELAAAAAVAVVVFVANFSNHYVPLARRFLDGIFSIRFL
jgi:hypothetical protein